MKRYAVWGICLFIAAAIIYGTGTYAYYSYQIFIRQNIQSSVGNIRTNLNGGNPIFAIEKKDHFASNRSATRVFYITNTGSLSQQLTLHFSSFSGYTELLQNLNYTITVIFPGRGLFLYKDTEFNKTSTGASILFTDANSRPLPLAPGKTLYGTITLEVGSSFRIQSNKKASFNISVEAAQANSP